VVLQPHSSQRSTEGRQHAMSADGPDPLTPAAPPPGSNAPTGELDDSSTDRLITLSDGVVAIALTLLILAIAVPDKNDTSLALYKNPNAVWALWDALGSAFDSWISYIVSFYVIAQFWMIHHRVFRGITRHTYGLAAWNFLFLLTISVMPFASDLVGKFSENPLSVILFSCNLIVANLAIHAMLTYSNRQGLLNERGLAQLHRYRSLAGVIDMSFFVIAIPVALWSPDLGKVCWAGLALSTPAARVVQRRRRT
jgi:uncharacterized membrane protein